jgi:hypothetical protein
LETLFAITVAVATLKAHNAPPVMPAQPAAVEQREAKAEKPKPRRISEPQIGF